ncbi:hypothetical protein GY45DRAFT_249924 [Cubamyces sp. BRFM 1775]|nr:hypothetical protein GY45DRAFT_249924 [Cubamyces sp. BRFM 1775]
MSSAGDSSVSAAMSTYFGDHGAGSLPVRRRRTSVSSKLLGLFAKPPPPPPKRPTISLPQPLEPRRAPSTCSDSSSVDASAQAQTHSQVAKRKRGSSEDSIGADENNEPAPGDEEDEGRATSRLRLDSTVSSHKAWPTRRLGVVSLATPSRALKSALKKSASEADADSDYGSGAVARGARTTKDPLSSEGASHNGAKGAGALKTTTQHNRGGSAYSPSSALTPSLPKHARRTSEVPSVVAGCTPFPSFCSSTSRSNATAQESLPPPTPSKKTVTFADEDVMVNLKRSRTFRDLSDATDDTWEELAKEIDSLGPKPISSDAVLASTTTGARRGAASPRRQSDPPPAISLKSSRAYKPLPLVPQMTPGRALSSNTKQILYETGDVNTRGHDSDFRALLARQAPPTPEATLKLKPFTLPTSTSTHKSHVLGKQPALKSKAGAGKENGSMATAMLDEVLKDIAKDKEERRHGRTVPKPVFKPCRDQSDVLRRFKIDIHADERHSTIWDGCETDIYAWSGTLVVHDAKPASYFYPRHSIHDFSIKFHTVAEPRSDPHTFDPTPSRTKYEWETTYRGHRIGSPANKDVPPGLAVPRLDPARGIAVETEYRLLPDDPDGPCRWEVRFWVPVPVRLFGRAEHRTFVCRAKVTVRDWETPKTDVPAGCIAVGIERLRSERLLTVPTLKQARHVFWGCSG